MFFFVLSLVLLYLLHAESANCEHENLSGLQFRSLTLQSVGGQILCDRFLECLLLIRVCCFEHKEGVQFVTLKRSGAVSSSICTRKILELSSYVLNV